MNCIWLKRIFKGYVADVEWIAVAQDKETWWKCCECGNEFSDSIKCDEFLEWLRNC